MHWNYRVLKTTHGDNDPSYGVHEVYYDEKGALRLYTLDPVAVVGDSVEDLSNILAKMARGVGEPVLTQGDFPQSPPSDQAERETVANTIGALRQLLIELYVSASLGGPQTLLDAEHDRLLTTVLDAGEGRPFRPLGLPFPAR